MKITICWREKPWNSSIPSFKNGGGTWAGCWWYGGVWYNQQIPLNL